MTKEEVLQKIKDLLADQIGMDEAQAVTENSLPEEVEGWDSLVQMELLGGLERTFSIKFDYRDMAGFKGVGDIVASVVKKLN